MKAIIEFNLPDDNTEHLRMVNANVAWDLIEEMDQDLRTYVKYGHTFESVEKLAENLRYRISHAMGVLNV